MTGPTPRRRRLGSELRRLRKEAGLTGRQAAVILDLNESMISRIEYGSRTIRSPDLAALMDAYGVTNKAKREAMDRLARDAKRRDWFREYDGIMGEPFRNYLSLESEATSILSFEPMCIWGLFQTEAYARAVLSDRGPDAAEMWLRLRMERQRILEQENPPLISAIIDESVLRRPTGGRRVMREQLLRLVSLAECPNITIQVLPLDHETGAFAGGAGFVSLQFEEASGDALFLEHFSGGLFLDDEDDLHSYGVIFERLQGVSLDPGASAKMIAGAAEELARDG